MVGTGGTKILSEYKKVRIIVAFGDISGFSDYCDAITNDEIEYDPLMRGFDKLIAEAERRTGYSFTDTGDGFMCTLDLDDDDVSDISIKIVLNLYTLFKNILALFDAHRKHSVCPDGFRIAFTAGYVKKKLKRDGRILLRGKSINQAHNYLEAARDYGMVCHESFKILMHEGKARASGIKLVPLKRFKKVWGLKISQKGQENE